jgi:hypothetical protein
MMLIIIMMIMTVCHHHRHSPPLFYPLTVDVEVVYLHLITLRHTPQWVRFLWTRDRPIAETSTWQHTNTVQETNIHAPGEIRTHDPRKRSAADLRLRPRGHWDRRLIMYKLYFVRPVYLPYFLPQVERYAGRASHTRQVPTEEPDDVLLTAHTAGVL